MDHQSQKNVDTIDLPGRPTCENCIAWSEEGLAVATAENVHIVTNRSPQTASDPTRQHQWNVETVRINLFSLSEWPEQDLASIQDVSIGEEQSDSFVTSLEWSAPGLGIHRRCVLAVLTSNLKLSLWESNGLSGQWKRSLIVNDALEPAQNTEQAAKPTKVRSSQLRIRAFTWLDPLVVPSENKWGMHYLALAMDRGGIIICRIQRSNQDSAGKWDINIAWQGELSENPAHVRIDVEETDLERSIRKESPIIKLEQLGWSVQSGASNTILNENWFSSELEVTHGNMERSKTWLVFRIDLEYTNGVYSASQNNTRQTQNHALKSHFKNAWQQMPLHERSPRMVANMPGKPWFKDSPAWELPLKEKVASYNQAFNLHDFFRVRYWGITYSSTLNLLATCVTLHPLDMFEYTTPATEKLTLVFRRFMQSHEYNNLVSSPSLRTGDEIASEIIAFLANNIKTQNNISETDAKVLNAWQVCAQKLKTERANGHSLDPLPMSDVEGVQRCDACDLPFVFDFSSEQVIARCQTGHMFMCCPLSLIALQEPGISKYCSACDREFLNLTAFQTNGEAHLTKALFDEFDTCVFCNGKFRG